MSEKKRELAAIMFTDIVGYSAMMQRDEELASTVRKRHREVFRELHEKYEGKILQYYGDGTLSIFNSAVAAVECAVEMQVAFRKSPQVPLRIGIHTGDITYEEEGAFGDGLNIAARIEPLCTPGGVFISGKVYDDIKNHPWLEALSLGPHPLKNILHPVVLFAVSSRGLPVPDHREVMEARHALPANAHRELVGVVDEKDKKKAVMLALFLGALGVHRFYLGQRRRAITYLIFGAIGLTTFISEGESWMLMIMVIIGFVDAVLLYSLSDAAFHQKFNAGGPEGEQPAHAKGVNAQGRAISSSPVNRFKRSGVLHFRREEYEQAFADFKRALKQEPEDMAVHFNLACCYSLFGQTGEALQHLAKSVEYGFWNYDKIHEHPALENLRRSEAFRQFVRNDYRLVGALPSPSENLLETLPREGNILDQIASLGELKDRGVITEEEFIEQKKRLLNEE